MSMAKSAITSITITMTTSMTTITSMTMTTITSITMITTMSMSTIMNMTKTALVAAMIMTIIITIITQMKCSQALALRLRTNITEAELKDILDKLANDKVQLGTILRSKGIVASEEGEWYHFDLVPGEYEVRRGAADYTGRICVIGSKLDEDGLRDLFVGK